MAHLNGKTLDAENNNVASATTTTISDKTSVAALLPKKLRVILKQDWAQIALHTNKAGRSELLILPADVIKNHKPEFVEHGSKPIKGIEDEFEGFHRLTLSQGAMLEESHEISFSKRKQLRTALTSAYAKKDQTKQSKKIPDDAPLQPRNGDKIYLNVT